MALTGCGSLQKSGVSGTEGRVVTLADGRQVVVSGQKDATQSSGLTTDKKNDKKLTPPKNDGKNSQSKNKKSKKKKDPQLTPDREAVD
ncbi:MAG: hypothetical protein K2I61_02060, partial [Muribaculaceae bacterium]|nr:hypothetical protein [Muribaculaceae bacterium]